MTPADTYALVTTGYYRNPEADLAGVALRQWLAMLADADDEYLARAGVVFYLFARISQVSPEARAAFAPVLREHAGRHAELARRLLTVDATFPNATALPIDGPQSLDLLWAEFFVTGADAPLDAILRTLDGDDVVRGRLVAWLQERSWFGGAKRRACVAELASVGLELALDPPAIVTEGDLDCRVFSLAERGIAIFRMLPFQLTEAELIRVATKASAVWSLRLNASSHARVAETCRREATTPGGPARRLLESAGEGPSGKPFAL